MIAGTGHDCKKGERCSSALSLLRLEKREFMTEKEQKQLAYVAHMLWKLATGLDVDFNERQSLDNIADELGFQEIDENYFRY